jgi:hypothetical protein
LVFVSAKRFSGEPGNLWGDGDTPLSHSSGVPKSIDRSRRSGRISSAE